MRLEWLLQALRDFEEIVDYIAEENPVAAIEQGDEIEKQVAGLLVNRHRGRPGRVKGTRELVIVRTPVHSRLSHQKRVDSDSPSSPRCPPLAKQALRGSVITESSVR